MLMKIEITKYGKRNWAVYFNSELLAVTVYKKGALAISELITRLGKSNKILDSSVLINTNKRHEENTSSLLL
jgi:hypothetical protein